MTGLNLISVFAIIAVTISLILAVFLLTVKTKHKLSNVLLATFILINGMDLSMLFTGQWLQHYPGLLVFLITVSLLNNPIFYLYALSICYSDFKLKPKHLLHAIPFVLINLELIPRFYVAGFTEKIFMLGSYVTIPELRWITITGHVQFTGYIIGIFLLLRKYRKIYLENYADPKIITYRWLFQLALVDTIVHGIVLIKDILKLSSSEDTFDRLQLVVGINAVFILCWFVFKALYNPGLFRGVSFQLRPLKNQAKPTANTETLAKMESIRRYMLENEPYLDPSLTVQELARQVKIPAKELSILINLYLGQHFFDFVNEYRVKKAMQLLREDLKKERTVQEIFFEVGFNSKSSFNTAFKKYAAITPKEYRNHPI